MIRVLIADDQGMVRAGFRWLLEAEADIAVVGVALGATPDPKCARDSTAVVEEGMRGARKRTLLRERASPEREFTANQQVTALG